jgi:hypothetical protein
MKCCALPGSSIIGGFGGGRGTIGTVSSIAVTAGKINHDQYQQPAIQIPATTMPLSDFFRVLVDHNF